MRLGARCVLIVSLTVSGCAGGMIPGTIYSSTGKTMQFEIEKAYGTGAMKAIDHSTGERFSGTYVGIRERIDGTSTAFVSGKILASGFGSASIESNIANATAFLKGDKGTMLTCTMQIEAGLSPHGIGGCDDNLGRKYRLQF